jgi:protein arginine kinase
MENKTFDVVLSSRVRLARNVEGLPFSGRIDASRAVELIKDVYEALPRGDSYTIYRMGGIKAIDGNALKEKHLISEDLLLNKASGAAIINDSETVSILVNEEDHIRGQCILGGLKLKEAYKTLNAVDDTLSKKIKFAYGERLGYITACPTNLGTGMRASVMMFLPGLTIYNSLEAAVGAIQRLNMAIRGVYGEGSDSAGYIYQVSNQKTLGLSEQQIIDSVEGSVGHIIDAEIKARESLQKTDGVLLRDRIMRAYGVLTNAYTLETREFMQLIALVKLGIYYDYIKLSDHERFNKLITNAQPALISSLSNTELSATERDVFRAGYVTKALKTITKPK